MYKVSRVVGESSRLRSRPTAPGRFTTTRHIAFGGELFLFLVVWSCHPERSKGSFFVFLSQRKIIYFSAGTFRRSSSAKFSRKVTCVGRSAGFAPEVSVTTTEHCPLGPGRRTADGFASPISLYTHEIILQGDLTSVTLATRRGGPCLCGTGQDRIDVPYGSRRPRRSCASDSRAPHRENRTSRFFS